MVCLRFALALVFLGLATAGRGQSISLPDAPQPSDSVLSASATMPVAAESTVRAPADSSSTAPAALSIFPFSLDALQDQTAGQTSNRTNQGKQATPESSGQVDANGNPIPLDRYQPHRLLGFMPNFRTVSAGAAVHPPGWKYNFTVATHQATDYSTFIFLGLTSLFAEGTDEHPSLGKGADGFYAYAWRGFLDKTDSTYLSAWLLASALHEDTRYYPLGSGHSIFVRSMYVISREGVTKTYSGHDTPNIAGLGGKVLSQYISTFYYPASSEDFGVLAEKFGYSVMRDVAFSSIREFYPDIAAHYIRKHRQKVAQQAARDAAASGTAPH
jgi:hypothetical protein